MSDLEAMKDRQRRVWGMGNYAVLARPIEPAATALCDACAVSAGQEVLDVGAGTGNLAVACAREGASVVASDLSPAMVERGRARTEAEGYEVEWVEADVEALPFEDGRFDCVASAFGAFIAPRPEVAAAEMFRVARPGGAVGLTAWVPDGFFGQVMAVGQRHTPFPEGVPAPQEWGDEATARARLEGLAGHVEIERAAVSLEAPSPEAFADEFTSNSPNAVAARETLPPEQFEQLRSEIARVARDWGGGDGPLTVDADYLLIVARKRG
jgi:ubiquinone/menaquinone biosynthesis C-methylase UbiE